MKYLVFLILNGLIWTAGISQSITTSELIKASIKYHDPEDQMMRKKVTLNLTETRPEGADRKTSLSFSIPKEYFIMERESKGHKIESELKKGKVVHKFDGSSSYSETVKSEHKLTDDRLMMMRSYYQYLWALPMKLNDPGTQLGEKVREVYFFGTKSLEIRVSYDPEVGKDVWFFYFDPESYALVGYRFYHDESKNDGEYILLAGEITLGSIRLPKERKWYTHKEDKFLGSDILDSIKTGR